MRQIPNTSKENTCNCRINDRAYYLSKTSLLRFLRFRSKCFKHSLFSFEEYIFISGKWIENNYNESLLKYNLTQN